MALFPVDLSKEHRHMLLQAEGHGDPVTQVIGLGKRPDAGRPIDQAQPVLRSVIV